MDAEENIANATTTGVITGDYNMKQLGVLQWMLKETLPVQTQLVASQVITL